MISCLSFYHSATGTPSGKVLRLSTCQKDLFHCKYTRHFFWSIKTRNVQKKSDKHEHNTRTKSHFQVPYHNTTLFSKAISYKGVQLFNKLPSHIKSITKRTLSKEKSLRSLLLKHCFFTVEEYLQTDLNITSR